MPGVLEQGVEDEVRKFGRGVEEKVGDPGQSLEDNPLSSHLLRLSPLFSRTVGTQAEGVGPGPTKHGSRPAPLAGSAQIHPKCPGSRAILVNKVLSVYVTRAAKKLFAGRLQEVL